MKKASKKKTTKVSLLRSFLIVFVILLMLPILGLSFVLSTFDVNDYREALAQKLSEKSGRTITLSGPIHWRFSFDNGLSIAATDITLGNPPWASRPLMAQIGNAKLHVDVMAILQKKLKVVALEINRADIQLETNASGATNWSFKSKTAALPDGGEKTKQKLQEANAPSITLDVQSVTVADSHVGLKGKDGKLSVYDIPMLTMVSSPKGSRIHYSGLLAGVVTEIEIAGGQLEAVTGASWPFNFQAVYGDLKFDARGSLVDNIKKIVMDDYLLVSGKSKAQGALTVALNGERPLLTGSVQSSHFNPADFKFEQGDEAVVEKKATGGKPSAEGPPKFFSREPLALEGFRSVDLALDVRFDELIVGMTTLQKVVMPLDLRHGRLTVAPFTLLIAGSKTEGRLTLDASQGSAQVAANVKAQGIDFSQLFKISGIESFIAGKSDFAMNLTTSGHSLHDWASYANGTIDLSMKAGSLSSSELKQIAGALLDVFAPGIGSLTSTGVKCMAARYQLTNGLMETKGLLIDTDMTTIAGSGYINLADERINMNLRTKPKGVGLGSALPPMKIYGALAAPSFTLDAAGAVQKVAGLLIGGNGAVDAGVPTMLTASEGQNACVATLDNPAAAKKATSVTTPLVREKVDDLKDAVKGLGGNLLKGLGNTLLGQ